MMDWQTIDSKMFTAAAYDAERRILYLRFNSGDVCRYFEFPEEHYRAFLNAESRGRYFLNHVRHYFRYERLARLRVA